MVDRKANKYTVRLNACHRNTDLCGQRPLLPNLVRGLDTDAVRVLALSVQRFLQNYHPRNRVDGK